MIDSETQRGIERLFARYVASIDEERLEEWPSYFIEDCRYKITSRDNYERNLPVGIFFATSRAMLEDRVLSLRAANVYEAQHYRHLTSSTLILSESPGVVAVQSHFNVTRIMQDGAMALFATGRYLDRISLKGPEPLFEERLVICDSRRIDTLLAIPL